MAVANRVERGLRPIMMTGVSAAQCPRYHRCEHNMAQLSGPSVGPERGRPAASARRPAARRRRGRQRSDRPGADAGRTAAARAVRGTGRARAVRHGTLRPPVVQPAGSPAGGDAGRRPADGPAARRLSRRAARSGIGLDETDMALRRLLAGHHDVAVRRARAAPARWPLSWASPARCSAPRSCRARRAAGRR